MKITKLLLALGLSWSGAVMAQTPATDWPTDRPIW